MVLNEELNLGYISDDCDDMDLDLEVALEHEDLEESKEDNQSMKHNMANVFGRIDL